MKTRDFTCMVVILAIILIAGHYQLIAGHYQEKIFAYLLLCTFMCFLGYESLKRMMNIVDQNCKLATGWCLCTIILVIPFVWVYLLWLAFLAGYRDEPSWVTMLFLMFVYVTFRYTNVIKASSFNKYALTSGIGVLAPLLYLIISYR